MRISRKRPENARLRFGSLFGTVAEARVAPEAAFNFSVSGERTGRRLITAET